MLSKKKGINTQKKFKLTTITSLIYQLITIVSGFILPKLILSNYGSNVNGLVVSITQFLSLISFLDMGVGQVIQSNLYEPLTKKDYSKVSDVLSSGADFFRKLARLFVIYTIFLAFSYPLIVKTCFGYGFIFSLIIIISINSFAQYYFGISYQLLLNSDQRGYIQYIINSATLILNIVFVYIMITFGSGIHAVKLVTSLIYILRPLGMYIYVRKTYPVVKTNIRLDYEPVKQKWNGFAQHMASVILNNTDTVVLTMFSILESVSIYAVYNLVVTGIKQIFMSLTNGIQPLLGKYLAEKNTDKLNSIFGMIEWGLHQSTVILFGCTFVLIVPFVKIYTLNINDCNYVAVAFALLLTAAHAVHCIRLPYNLIVLAGGHFKQTQNCYIIAALINIITSIILVIKFGLVGVAIGTLISMTYQTLWLVRYVSKNIIYWPKKFFLKQLFVDFVVLFISLILTQGIQLKELTYISWIIMSIKVGLVWLMVSLVINVIFNRVYLKDSIKKFLK